MPANNTNSIENFINGFHGGTRLNRFIVQSSCPAVNRPFHIRAAQIPGAVISSIGLNWFGRTIELPGERVYQPWVITVLDDAGDGYELHSQFETWQHSIGNKNEFTHVQLANAFQKPSSINGLGCQFDIRQYRTDSDEEEKDFILYNVWPLQIGAVELDQSKDNQLVQFSVTLAYSHFV
jgi:hypothetical protein